MTTQSLLRSLVLACLLVALCLTAAAPQAAAAPSAPAKDGRQVVGYFIEWGVYGRNYLVKDIVTSGSASKLTIINYAFANAAPDTDGNVVCKLFDEWADYQKPWTAEQSVTGEAVTWPNRILGNFQQLKALKAMYPDMRVLISLGGWTGSKWFSDAALTPASRQLFVKSCVDMFIKGDLPDPGWGGMGGPGAAAGVFDGIDVDWEYPAAEGNPGNIYRPEDTQNFTLLLQEFRTQLDAVRPGVLLTIAAPAGQAKHEKIELDKVSTYLNFINLMTYDLHGPWDSITNFQSNLYATASDPTTPKLSTDGAVQAYLDAGVPAGKLVVGVPFYGHGWTGVPDQGHGLYQPAAGPAAGTWEAGSEDYKVLAAKLAAGATSRYWSEEAKAAWLFDGADFWTYDDAKMMCYKASYVRHNRLGGVMFWELSGDTTDGELIDAIAEGVNQPGQGWAYERCQQMP